MTSTVDSTSSEECSSSDLDYIPNSSSEDGASKSKRRAIMLKNKVATGATPKKVKKKEEMKAKLNKGIRCIKCNKILLNIAEHMKLKHGVADPGERRKLCVLSRQRKGVSTSKKICPKCQIPVQRLDKHLQRFHKFKVGSPQYKAVMGKREFGFHQLKDFEEWLNGPSGGGNEVSSVRKVVADVENIFRRTNGVTLDPDVLELGIIVPKYKCTTVYNLISSIKHFVRFALVQGDLFKRDEVQILDDHVHNWGKTYKKKADSRGVKINSQASVNLIPISRRQQYANSSIAKMCEAEISGEASSSREITLADVTGHLMLSLILQNAQRPAAITGLLWEDLFKPTNHEKVTVIKSHNHKTSGKHGSAFIAIDPKLHSLIVKYKDLYAVSGPFLFSTDSKTCMSDTTALKRMKKCWVAAGLGNKFTPTLWRKSVVTAVHKQFPDMKERLAKHMSHSVTTAIKIYNCVEGTHNASEVAAMLDNLNNDADEDLE